MSLDTNGSKGLIEWTPANVVTTVRVCLIPLFVVLAMCPWGQTLFEPAAASNIQPFIAMGLFALIALTDTLDGYLARSRNEVTVFGKFMDPIADKLLVVSALVCLVELSLVPGWVLIVIISREFLVSGLRMLVASSGTVVAASWIGKAKTFSTMIAICMFIIMQAPLVQSLGAWYEVLAWATMLACLALTIWSMVDYFVKAWPLLSVSQPATRPGDDTAGEEPQGAPYFEISSKIVMLAERRGARIGTAESCTGGLVASCLTSVPGASKVVAGGVVSYMTDIKVSRLAVDPDVIDRFGVVSQKTAAAMAQGGASALSADYVVSVTGLAGPGGGTDALPVGTVCIGLHTPCGDSSQTYHFEGSRDCIRDAAVLAALNALLGALEFGE